MGNALVTRSTVTWLVCLTRSRVPLIAVTAPADPKIPLGSDRYVLVGPAFYLQRCYLNSDESPSHQFLSVNPAPGEDCAKSKFHHAIRPQELLENRTPRQGHASRPQASFRPSALH